MLVMVYVITLLAVQGIYNSFNMSRQDYTYVLYTCMHAMNCNLDLLGPTSVSSTTALNDLYHSNLAFSEVSQLLSVDSPAES